jgi:hypothetical protein
VKYAIALTKIWAVKIRGEFGERSVSGPISRTTDMNVHRSVLLTAKLEAMVRP